MRSIEPGIHSSTNLAVRWIPGSLAVLAPRNDNGKEALQTHPLLPAARFLGPGSPRLGPSLRRGRGKCRAHQCARSLVCERKKHTSLSHRRYTGRHPAFPARWLYGFLRARPGDRAFLPPSPARSSTRGLDISVGISGPHDFAVRADAFVKSIAASIASRAQRS